MSIDIVLVTNGKRPDLLEQSWETLILNGSFSNRHTFVIVQDGYRLHDTHLYRGLTHPDIWIINPIAQGASASRNIGASTIPKYRRGKYVMFCDDDVYFAPKWDEKIIQLLEMVGDRIVSGCAHPFNHGEYRPDFEHPQLGAFVPYTEPLVISTPHFMLSWSIWDDVGYFVEPGGAGGSEDYDYCMRAKAKGYGFAVTSPEVVLHCGITSSNGNPIVGQKEVIENNKKLEEIHGIVGKVQYR